MWKKPTLIIDTLKVRRNIEKMLRKTVESKVVFRPHFKTHQSAKIGEIFRKKGVDKITVSSVSMAEYFAHHGWNDITIAFPVNLLEINEINKLASTISLNLLVESSFSANILTEHITNPVGIFIKIDTGYHRTGIDPHNSKEIDSITEIIKTTDYLQFKGFLAHAGHTYSTKSVSGIEDIYQTSVSLLNELKRRYIDDFPKLIISYGDTPSCSIIEDFSNVDEIRPGNFVYYDIMQYQIGSCATDDIAVAVACPVVAIHPERSELVIYGGAVHLSKEFITDNEGKKNYGLVVHVDKNGWGHPIEEAYVSSISQEHGIIKMKKEELNQFKPGNVIGILPIHSCLTVNLLKQ